MTRVFTTVDGYVHTYSGGVHVQFQFFTHNRIMSDVRRLSLPLVRNGIVPLKYIVGGCFK